MKVNEYVNSKAEDFLSGLPDEVLDLTVTSPPYDDLREYNGFSFDSGKVISELFRTTKSGGVVVWVVTMRICDTCGAKWFDSGSCPNCNPQTEEDKK